MAFAWINEQVAMLVGAWAYGAFLTATPLRPLFFMLQLFNAAAVCAWYYDHRNHA